MSLTKSNFLVLLLASSNNFRTFSNKNFPRTEIHVYAKKNGKLTDGETKTHRFANENVQVYFGKSMMSLVRGALERPRIHPAWMYVCTYV